MTIDENFLQVLACPQCKGPVTEQEEGLHCEACALTYPVIEGIPRMLVEVALAFKNKSSSDAGSF